MGGRLGHTLVKLGFVDEQAMVLALSQQLNVPVVDLDNTEIPREVAQYLRHEIAVRLVSAQCTRTRSVACSGGHLRPHQCGRVSGGHVSTGMRIEFAVSTAEAIERAIRRIYDREQPRLARTAPIPAPVPNPLLDRVEALTRRSLNWRSRLLSSRNGWLAC